MNLALHYRPEVIIFGGGVLDTPTLIEKIRLECLSFLGAYLPELNTAEAMERLIATPRLGSDAGILGAFMLAQRAFLERDNS